MEKKKKKTEETKTFESALEELEEIASELETGELGLDEALGRYEKGVQLSRFCRKKLDEAARKIDILQKQGDEIISKPVKLKDDEGEIEEGEDVQGELL
ncbi:MAG TPA: exodeoxyribonuclease VII small subunit [Spirochaetota bacterium]|nr:exodeoxyribonuclease VII small subunit [Spirochaetota bacterium]HOR45084.1 exodeoxyribonuclease VII small subunit [Spirochaetota bacterium]HOU85475.1 exodeoxyribonuclease VII small subunit [Spirochaetota bacterium]HPK56596.1 exodeoxyribonuclease VII small subunit [Spirochaetota bacterium]HQE59830.1 exodeoxyribonuclease VII small subunit [Spirochaetota bacterium]